MSRVFLKRTLTAGKVDPTFPVLTQNVDADGPLSGFRIIDALKTNNTLWYLNLRRNQLSSNMKSQLKAIKQYKKDGSNGYQQVKGMYIYI